MNEFKSPIGVVGCYLENVGEFLQEFEENNVTTDGKVDKITIAAALTLMQESLNKYKESKLECEGKELEVSIFDINEGYFETMGLSLLEGRKFEPEFEQSDAEYAVIVNEKLVKDFGWEKPIGKK